MNVLLLDMGALWRGGQRQVLYLASRLAKGSEFRPLVAAPRGAPLLERAREAGLACLELPGRRDWDLRNLFALRRVIRGRSIGLIHTQDARSASLGALYRLVFGGPSRQGPFFRGGPLLVHSRRVSYALGPGWSRAKYALADMVVAVSAQVQDVLAASGLDPRRLAVVHSGIDPSRYTTRPAAGPGAERRELVFGSLGALSPQKGHEVFLRALALVAAMPGLPPWRAVVVGEGALRAFLEALARDLGLAGRVAFAGFQESWQALLDMDVLAVPSVDGEGSNAVVKEGWAARVPVVVSDLAANLELVEPDSSGLVFANRDERALASALARAARDAGLRRALAEAGSRRVALFTDQAMAEGVMACYRRAAELAAVGD